MEKSVNMLKNSHNRGGGDRRFSNIEILRLLAMVFVLLSHFSYHTFKTLNFRMGFYPNIIGLYLHSLGQFGVELFVLITGYFMIEKDAKVGGFLKIAFETVFYSYSILLIFLFFSKNSIPFKQIYNSLLPLGGKAYWFISAYLILYLCIPVINMVIRKISKRTFEIIILSLVFVFFIFATMFKSTKAFGLTSFDIFLTLYCIGAYIKLYGIKIFDKLPTQLLCVLQYFVLLTVWYFICFRIGKTDIGWLFYFSEKYSPFLLFAAVGLFHFFKNLNIPYNKFINFFAASCFSAYIITSHPCLLDNIWTGFFGSVKYANETFINPIMFLIHGIICSVVSIFACAIFDKLRIKFVEKPFLNFIDKKIPIKTIKL